MSQRDNERWARLLMTVGGWVLFALRFVAVTLVLVIAGAAFGQ